MRNAAHPVLSATGLTKRYPSGAGVEDLTFALEPGTVTGFLGPNGAGKSTTLRMVLGLSEPSAGTSRVFGQPYRQIDQPVRLVGAVLESGDFHPGRTGRNHLRVVAAQAGLGPRRIDDALATVGLTAAADRAVKGYSLGMRQRLGIAAALLGEPRLLILDEPANGLDPAGVRWLRLMLRSFADAGGTALVSSHLLAEIAQTVDRVLILARGKLVADAAISDLDATGRDLEQTYLELTDARGAAL